MTRLALPLLLLACHGQPERPPATDSTSDTQTITTGTTGTTGDTAPLTIPPGEPLLQFKGDPPKNVLMISVDTFRRDHLTRYGGDNFTPFLDKLAAEGVVLDDHQQCANWTFASTSCTLNGRYPVENGFMPRLNGAVPLPDGQPTLARALGEAGVYSTLLSTNAWLSAKWGNAQGYTNPAGPGGGHGNENIRKGMDRILTAQEEGLITDGWFLHVHLLEPHAPYIPPAEFAIGLDELDPIPWDLDTQDAHYQTLAQVPNMTQEERDLLELHMRTRYAGEVRYVDAMIEQMWPQLEEEGFLDDTLVVFWTDHGEGFWEHDKQTHAHLIHDEENNGIAFFWAKNLRPVAWPEPTHAVDLLPSILTALELPVDEALHMGYPVGTAPIDRPRYITTHARDGVLQGVTKGDMKLEFHWASGTAKLYDRGADPTELNDLIAADTQTRDELWRLLAPRVEELDTIIADQSPVWPVWAPPRP